ncbi:MAG: glycosyltransferase family 2 protein [Ruminococcus sp.]|jgi:glycosyltransferase involved in cell wall biosynthesis|nr:glycosyltransferase family 2 protein [Ruminococcus sp.]
MQLNEKQVEYLIKLYDELVRTKQSSEISAEEKIDSLITILSDQLFDKLAQFPIIADTRFDFGTGSEISFAEICGAAAKLALEFLPSASEEKLPVLASLATYTAVLAGYRNPMIPIMGNGPKAVILTLCHNSKKTLDKAAKSVLTQTYWNFEYILADNASTDNTREKILEIEKSDPRVKHIFYDTNKFPDVYVDLIPRILENKEYKYFAVCDHDDEFFPKFLELSVREAETDKVDVVFMGQEGTTRDKNAIPVKCSLSQFYEKEKIVVKKGSANEYQLFISHNFFAWYSVLYSTDAIRKSDVTFHEKTVRMHDVIYTIDVLINSNSYAVVNYIGHRHYADVVNSASKKADMRNLNAPKMFYSKYLEFLKAYYEDKNGLSQALLFNAFMIKSSEYIGYLNFSYYSMTKSELITALITFFDNYEFYIQRNTYFDNKPLDKIYLPFRDVLLSDKKNILSTADKDQKVRLNRIFDFFEKKGMTDNPLKVK